MIYRVGTGWSFEGCTTTENLLGFVEKSKSRTNTEGDLVVEIEAATDIELHFLPLYTETANYGTIPLQELNPQLSVEERVNTFVRSNKRCITIPAKSIQFLIVSGKLVFNQNKELRADKTELGIYTIRNIGRNFEQYDKSILTSATPFFMCDKLYAPKGEKETVGVNDLFEVTEKFLSIAYDILLQKLTFDNLKSKADYYLFRLLQGDKRNE